MRIALPTARLAHRQRIGCMSGCWPVTRPGARCPRIAVAVGEVVLAIAAEQEVGAVQISAQVLDAGCGMADVVSEQGS